MTFKATAAVLALLPVLAGAIHSSMVRVRYPMTVCAEQEIARPLRAAEPVPAPASVRNAMLFSGVVDAAQQASRSARTPVPEPQALLWLGLALLLIGVWRGRQKDRNRPAPNSETQK